MRETTGDLADSVEERPLAEYATLTTAFWTVFGAFLLVGRDRIPERIGTGDFLRMALSTYKMSRLLAKDEVTSFLRAPVTEDPKAQQPKRAGMAAALGELVTCPYCLGLWFAAGLAYAHAFFPRETRFATTIFGSYAVTDFLNAAFVRLRGES